MSLINRTCKKITKAGTRCKLPRFKGGLCRLHAYLSSGEPSLDAALWDNTRAREQLTETIERLGRSA